MTIKTRFLTLVVAALLSAGVSQATTWYVASAENGGDNANDGHSPSTPKVQISSIQSTAAAGDIIYVIGERVFTSTLTVSKNITIAGYGPGAAISGGNACLPLKLNASGAVVSNLVIKCGKPEGAAASTWSYPAAGLEISAGTVVDCVFRDCGPRGSTHTATVNMSGGTLLRCVITNNTAGIQTASYGAGVYLGNDSAVLKDCEIAYNHGRGCTVYMTKGKVTGCDIHHNRNYPVSELASGVSAGSGAGARLDGGLLERSRIHDNYSYGNGGGLWLRDNGRVLNCLIYDNHSENNGGAITANNNSPKVQHCNFGGNTAATSSQAIYTSAGTPSYVNCIVFGNGSDPDDEIGAVSGVTPSFTYCLLPKTISGTGNAVLQASPFVDAANGDYLTAMPLANAVDRGSNGYATMDFLGTARPLDGDGDGTDKVDIGAVEYNPESQGGALAVITPSATLGPMPFSVTFSLDLTGFNATNVTAVWDFGDGTATVTTNALVPVVHTYGNGAGVFFPSVDVSDLSNHACSAQFLQGITVKPTETFVSPSGGNVSPYDTPAKAARSISSAVSALSTDVRGMVTILPGEYQQSSLYTLDKAVTLCGDGPLGSVVLSGRGANAVLKLNHADAVVTNLAIRNGYSAGVQTAAASASGVEIASGLMTHCEISGCRTRSGYSAQAVVLSAANGKTAMLRGCVVTNNTGYLEAIEPSGQYPRGAGVYIGANSTVENCRVADNRAWSGGGVFMGSNASASYLRECVIERNHAHSTGGGVLSFNGTIDRCHIVSNATAGSGGGLRSAGSAKVRNCLVTGNTASNGGGMYATAEGDTLIHCTFADNTAETGAGATLSAGRLAYSIAYGNHGGEDIALTGSASVTYTCSSNAVAGTGNFAFDPLFRDAAAGDFRLAAGSPCRDAARSTAVNSLSTTVDFNYVHRPIDSDGVGEALPDMGAFEMEYEEAAPALYLSADKIAGNPGATFSFTTRPVGFVAGPETEFLWEFGDAAGAVSSGAFSTTSHVFSVGGLYAVRVRAIDAGNAIDVTSDAVSIAVRVPETFVSTEGSATPPYDTPARAASSLADAFAYTYAPSGSTGVMHVAEGMFNDRSALLTLDSPIRILGAGRDRTVVSGIRMSLQHACAYLDGVTITNIGTGYPFVIEVTQGTVANSAIRGIRASYTGKGLYLHGEHNPARGLVCLATNIEVSAVSVVNTSTGAGVRMEGGALLVDSVVRDCVSVGSGAGISVSGGVATNVVLRCAVTGNRTTGSTTRGAGLHGEGNSRVRVEDSVFANNYAGGCGAIALDESCWGLLLNLVVTNNECLGYSGAGIRFDGDGIVANCLIRDNRRDSDFAAAALFLWKGLAVNCTVVGNRCRSGTAGILLYGPDARLLNCVSCDNLQTSTGVFKDVARENTTDFPAVTNLLTGTALAWEGGNIIVTDNPRLRPDGTPRGDSPAVDAGDAALWQPEWGTRDLGGGRRFRGASIDLGCFEYANKASVICVQ